MLSVLDLTFVNIKRLDIFYKTYFLEVTDTYTNTHIYTRLIKRWFFKTASKLQTEDEFYLVQLPMDSMLISRS